MSATLDIFLAWVKPRAVMARRLARGTDEKVAFAYLAVFSVLGFVSTLPGLLRQSRDVDPERQARMMEEAAERGLIIPADPTDATFESLMSGSLMGWIFIVPLLFYALAFLSRQVARLLGGRGDGLRARTALFWSALAITPAMLLTGLTTGFVGEGPAAAILATVMLSGFIWIWLNSLYVAEVPE